MKSSGRPLVTGHCSPCRQVNDNFRMKPFRLIAVLLLAVCALCRAHAQSTLEQQAQALVDAKQWQQAIDLLAPLAARSAELDFLYGTALAKGDRWDEAAAAFDAGRRLAPREARFAVELAGVRFHQKRYGEAARLLRRARTLEPVGEYTHDFLATVYLLEGNTAAAIQEWNRIGKPQLAEVRTPAGLRTAPALLDRAFVFAPASQLKLNAWYDTQTRLDGLDVLSPFHLSLAARDDGRFDAELVAQERNGIGNSRWALAAMLITLPFENVRLEYGNLRGNAVNFSAFYRWDAQKRRVETEISAPFERRAELRTRAALELRDENWVVRDSFTGTAPALGSANMRREAVDLSLASFARERQRWSAGVEISHRDFRSVDLGSALTPELLAKGYALKPHLGVASTLLRLPEHRFRIEAEAESETGRLWSASPETFEKLRGTLGWHWLPQAQGDTYELSHTVRAGRAWGTVPFDELAVLGLERDNDLDLRAHIGTRDGRKGSAPLGTNFVLTNFDVQRKLFSKGMVTVHAGPFVDAGAISGPGALGSHQWLCDVGAEARLRVLGRGVAFSYGRDTRTGNNAFYVTVLPARSGDSD